MIYDFRSLVNLSAKKFKNRDFLICADSKYNNISFENTKKFVDQFDFFLSKNSINFEDKILVIMHNSNFLTLLFLSIISSFRVFVPINPKASLSEVEYIINQTNPKLFICDKIYSDKFKNLHFKKKVKKIFVKDQKKFINKIFSLKSFKIKKNPIKLKKNFISEILFTSGSTGNPKGVVLTHKSILSNLHGINNRLKINDKKPRFLAITPLFHNNGQFIPTLLPLMIGGSTTPIQSDTSLLTFWNVCIKNQINYSSVMATHINYFLKMKPNIKGNKLRGLFCGGAKLDKNSQKIFEKNFKIKIATNYGLTETSSIVSSESLSKIGRKTGSVGKPLFNNIVKINKYRKKNYGEIYTKGENVFYKYLNDPTQTKNKIKNNWFRTGDLGYFDKNNFLFIKDRVDNMIIVSGENIYPSEIENYLYKFKEIKLGVVTSIKDKLTQNKLILIYEGKKNLDKNKFYKIISRYISDYKIPKLIYHCSQIKLKEIPKAQNKKILRSKLKNYINNSKKLFEKFR